MRELLDLDLRSQLSQLSLNPLDPLIYLSDLSIDGDESYQGGRPRRSEAECDTRDTSGAG